jgi:HNH endonuclease
MLWGRAAGRCSKPDCRIDLYEDETETDDPTLVGENCHIVADKDDGPRADPTMPVDQRNSYANLILLCRNHHKVIDAQEGQYTVERLQQMKAEHESWVRQQLGFDAAKQFDDEQYAGIIDTWERLAHIDEWHGWTSYVLGSGQPRMRAEVFRDLEELRTWLLNRVWPRRYPELESAFENFRRVLQDFHEQFRKHAEAVGVNNEVLMTRKFYRSDKWDEERYERLAKQYDFHVDLVEDLMLELTRAANLIADRVRQHLIRSYRLAKGRLVVEYGPTGNLVFHQVVVQYGPGERDRNSPYPGLQAFLTERAQRDRHFGEGTNP